MKKILLFISLALTFFSVSFVRPVFAIDLGVDITKQAAGKAGYDAANTNDTTFAQNIGSIIRAILTITGVIFTALVFYAGYLWMTARGDEANVTKAKDIIEACMIGLIITLASFGITNFVMKSILSKTTTPITTPAGQ